MSKVIRYPKQSELQEVFEIRDGELWRKKYRQVNIRTNGDLVFGRWRGGTPVKPVVNKSQHYCRAEFKGKQVYYHILKWIMFNGDIPNGFILDHIDGNKLNNDISNLRLVTKRENDQNKKCHRNGKLPGVSYRKDQKKWRALAQIDYKTYSLGSYNTEQEAHEVYKKFLKDRGVA